MPQDAFTIKYLSKELSELVTGGKISKITQPNKNLLTFIIYTENGSLKLEICLSAKYCRLNITQTESAAPKVAPGFCMLLRKHLQNALITKVEQIDGERIVYFDFDCTSEFELLKMRLYVELMGKYSNAVLTMDGIILGALKQTAIGESTKRVLFTGAKYALPEPQEKVSPLNMAELTRLFENLSGDTAKFISEKIRGVSYATALDIVAECGENPSAEQVYRYLNGDKIMPCVTFSDGKESDFKVRSCDKSAKPYDTVLQAQTAYYTAVCERNAFEEKKRKLSSSLASSIKKLEKRLTTIEQKLLYCKDLELVKLKGELITANIYAIKRGMDGFEAVNYYDEGGGTVKIALDRSLSPADNAQKYYKRYAKLKRTVATVTEQKAETEERLAYLNSINSNISAGESLADFEETEEELKALGIIPESKEKKKIQKTVPFRSYEFMGFKIFVGRNNLQNDRLLKSVSPRDMWLHTQNYHSSHVVIICGDRDVPDEAIKTAAEICAYYSDAKYGTKVPVDYTRRTFVKKPPKSNAGFVIYTDYKTALVNPDPHTEIKEN